MAGERGMGLGGLVAGSRKGSGRLRERMREKQVRDRDSCFENHVVGWSQPLGCL